jgi:Tfp pilus assembly protein PilZ
MTHPAEQARGHIMSALSTCQEDASLADRLRDLTRLLAKAQRRLYPAGQLPVNSPGCMDMLRRAMETLAQALQILQDVQVDSGTSHRAASSIAAALKLLHPLVHAAPLPEARVSKKPSIPPYVDEVSVDTMLSTGSSHQIYNGFSQNVRDGGIFIATFETRHKGADVLVNFKLPENKIISTAGVVQFVREYNPNRPDVPPGMGVKFRNLTRANQQAIEEFLETRTAMFYDD